jgi:hypothetical protein
MSAFDVEPSVANTLAVVRVPVDVACCLLQKQVKMANWAFFTLFTTVQMQWVAIDCWCF